MFLSDKNRPCGPRPNKHNNAYTKEELVNQIVQYDLMPKEDAERATMKVLCEELNIDYTDPSGVEMSKYSECLKTYKKKDIVESYKEYFEEKGFTTEQIRLMKKEKLCDIIYAEDSEFVVPEDFDEVNCGLYDMGSLTRIAVRRHIDTTRYKTQGELCRAIHVSYLREKMNFNTDKNPEWDNLLTVDGKDPEIYSCMIPKTEDKRLQEHQIRVVKHMLTHRALLAIHATGTGKTLTAVSTINCMLAKYPNIRIVIITPLSLVDNMKKEMKKFGLNLKKDPELYTRVEIYSYDEYVNLQRRKREVECKNTLLIIDEAHNLRTDTMVKESKLERGTKSYVIMKCAANAFKVLLLTATPIINNIYDIRNLLMMLDGTDPEKAIKRTDYLKEIQTSLGNMVNCKVSYYDPPKDENYPQRIDHTIDMYMDSDYYKKYKEIEMKHYNPIVDGNILKPGAKDDYFFHNLRVSLNSLDGEMSPKVNWIFDFITKEASEGRKSVVYSNWKSAGMNLIRKRLDSLNEQGLYIYISGDVPSEVRKLARKKFNKDESKILLITRAGGEGLDLKGVRNVIIMESNWNASSDSQIIGRGIRYKSHLHLPEEDRNVSIYRLLLHKPKENKDILPSIDDLLYKKAYQEKLPLIKEYLNIIKNNSIEGNGCSCSLGDKSNPIGCQSITIPEVKGGKDVGSKKNQVYEAPSGLTSIAIKVDEVSKGLFRRLAGLGAKNPSQDATSEEEIELGEELPEEEEPEIELVEELQEEEEPEIELGEEELPSEEEEEPDIVIEEEDF